MVGYSQHFISSGKKDSESESYFCKNPRKKWNEPLLTVLFLHTFSMLLHQVTQHQHLPIPIHRSFFPLSLILYFLLCWFIRSYTCHFPHLLPFSCSPRLNTISHSLEYAISILFIDISVIIIIVREPFAVTAVSTTEKHYNWRNEWKPFFFSYLALSFDLLPMKCIFSHFHFSHPL